MLQILSGKSACSLKKGSDMNAIAQPVFSASQEAMLKLNEVDLSHVKASCLLHGHYAPSEIDQVADEYKKYIALAVSKGQGGLPISRKLDEFWHTHILHTQSYMSMCMRVAGRYIHHRPKSLDDESALRMHFVGDTLTLYRENFGEPNPYFWDVVECNCE